MKHIKSFLSIILFFSLIILSTQAADYSCPGENVEYINGATETASKGYEVKNPTGNISNQARYWKFTTDTNGSITIRQKNNRAQDGYYNHKLQIGSSCGAVDIYNGGSSKDDSYTFNVFAGTTYYVRVKENNTRNQLNFDIDFAFTKKDIIVYPCSNPHEFITRFNEYIPGDLVAIGNSNICADLGNNSGQGQGDGRCDQNQKQRNDTINIIHNNKYSSRSSAIYQNDDLAGLLNVSNATLNLPDGAKVVWAGLYWHGSVWNFNKDVITNTLGKDSGDDGLAMMAIENIISVKTPIDDSFSSRQADDGEHYWFNVYRKNSGKTYGYGYGNDFNYTTEHAFTFNNKFRNEQHYQGFIDFTDDLKAIETANGTANGVYWVGNIQATVGNLWYPGVEAGWTLQVVYKLPSAQPRVITVTDGYVGLYGSASEGTAYANRNNCPNTYADTGVYANEISFDINNILTPKKSDFATDMTVFVTESDPDKTCATSNLPEDLTLTKKDGSIYYVDGTGKGVCDAWKYAIKDKNGLEITREPAFEEYPIGMTLKNYHMRDALSPEQNSTKITFKTDSDRLVIGVIGFATDLQAPKLCYGYDVRVGERVKVSSYNREINTSTWGTEPLQLRMYIRSETADFDFDNAKLKVKFNPAAPAKSFTYITGDSEISPPDINTYIPATETGVPGQIAIGHDTTVNGGTIESNETSYVKQFFDFTGNRFDGSFDIEVEGNVTFIQPSTANPDGLTIHYELSTATPEDTEGHIPLCPTNPIYDPIWGQFNVENTDGTDIYSRAPLYTQVTGREYEISIVNYTQNTAGIYSEPAPTEAIVEVELIDASTYDNNASTGYDVTCQEPTAEGQGFFVDLNGNARKTVEPLNFTQYDDTIALQSAAFRIWVLTKQDSDDPDNPRLIVIHNCANADESSCFDKLYTDEYKTEEDNETKYCESKCTSSTGSTCYECLKDYFGSPTCSRDNFSIRPKAFNIKINDTNQTDGTGFYTPKILTGNYTDVSPKKNDLAAGYKYQLGLEAKMYDDNTNSTGYYHYFEKILKASDINPLPNNIRTSGTAAIFDFTGSSSCHDTNNTSYTMTVKNSTTLGSDATFAHANVGTYDFFVSDADWTRVDQADYAYKTTFPKGSTPQDDCIPDSTASTDMAQNIQSLVGCTISSVIDATDYTDIQLQYHPYSLYTSINLLFIPNNGKNLLMNDFSNSYYDDVILHPISMSATFDGNITSLAKGSTSPLSNFTNSCAASDLTIKLLRNSSPAEDSSLVPPVILQRYLQYSSSVISNKIEDNNSDNTLSQTAFSDTAYLGIAGLKLHTTFKKTNDSPLDPIEIQYHSLLALATSEGSYVDWDNTTKHIPTGESIYDKNATFFYAKITPAQALYGPVLESRKKTPIFIDVYCSPLATSDCNATYGLDTGTLGSTTGSWYLANIFNNTGLGVTDLKVSTVEGSNANPLITIDADTPAKNVTDVGFNNPATKEEIDISVTGPARPTTVKVEYSPVPWLILNPSTDYYRVRFIGPSSWAGVGNPGHVSDADSSHEAIPRMNW